MAADRLVRFVARAGWWSCLGSIALAWSAPGLTRLPAVQWMPWLAGLFILGIPHGAHDHRVGAGLLGRDGAAAGPGFFAAYLSAGALVLACWFVSPMAASAGFLAVAAAHFGQGDVYWSRESGLASRAGSVGYRVCLLLARGALPIALPLLAFPGEFAGEASRMATRLFGRSGWAVPHWAINWGLAAVSVCVVLQVGWAAWIGLRGGGDTRREAVVDASETLLLSAMFLIVPPVLALGVYFNAWHSLRHIARLLKAAGPARSLVEAGRLAGAFAGFSRQALPMTAAATAMMAGLGLAVGRGLASVADLGMLALVLLSALTLPHVLVVAWMDRRQGIWSRRRRAEEVDHVRV